jgi:NAD(P)-dependent dehydrogenase (short-subunit alcohol dehydrogenase family)
VVEPVDVSGSAEVGGPAERELAGSTALVTGGGAGIGAAIARELAAAGAVVVINDLDGDTAERTAGEVRAAGGRAEVLVADVGTVDGAEGLVDRVLALGAGLDVVVNNAGIGHDVAPATEATAEVLDHLLAVNLRSQVLICAQAVPHLLAAGRGRIVNIGSRSWLGAPGQADYAATKGAIVSYSRALAAEVADRGITVNVVCPGTVITPALGRLDAATLAGLERRHPAGRFGQPEDVAMAVRYLVSPGSAAVTGHVLHVCGGRSVHGGPLDRWPTRLAAAATAAAGSAAGTATGSAT